MNIASRVLKWLQQYFVAKKTQLFSLKPALRWYYATQFITITCMLSLAGNLVQWRDGYWLTKRLEAMSVLYRMLEKKTFTLSSCILQETIYSPVCKKIAEKPLDSKEYDLIYKAIINMEIAQEARNSNRKVTAKKLFNLEEAE